MISKELRKKLIKSSFEIDLFETTIFVIKDKDIFQSVYDDIKHNADTENASGLCLSTTENGVKDIFVGIFSDRDDILVHECVHASLYILDNIDESANCNSELQPYLVQTIFRKIKELI